MIGYSRGDWGICNTREDVAVAIHDNILAKD